MLSTNPGEMSLKNFNFTWMLSLKGQKLQLTPKALPWASSHISMAPVRYSPFAKLSGGKEV
ncbi:MAG: hypothetical protein IPQ18_00720 [Saprospiraceae bacterium]|nr:hypothetical protein [Saprospiraceae bacterium]